MLRKTLKIDNLMLKSPPKIYPDRWFHWQIFCTKSKKKIEFNLILKIKKKSTDKYLDKKYKIM